MKAQSDSGNTRLKPHPRGVKPLIPSAISER